MLTKVNHCGYAVPAVLGLRFIEQPEGAPANRAARRRRLVTIAQCASYLGVTPRTVRNYVSQGFFPGYRIPGTRGIRLDLDEVNWKLKSIPATKARLGSGSFGPNAKIVELPPQPVRPEIVN